jgi:hypothetical protein
MSEDSNREVEVMEAQPLPEVSEITEPTTGSLQRLEAEALAMDKAYKIAKALSATQMVPEHFQRDFKPRGCTDPLGDSATWNLSAAIMYGAELGLTAIQSAQNIFVIHGKPAVYARTMAAQVRRAGYKIEEVEASDERVIWRGLRDGNWASSEWTMARATQAGYTSNERYQTNPQEMLRAKAISEVCRIQYQDVLLGMAYSVEELQLDTVVVTRPVKTGVRGTAKLREIAEAAQNGSGEASPSEPEAKPEPPEPPAPAEVPMAIEEQKERIRDLYRAKGVSATGVLEDISTFFKLDRRLPSLHKLSSAQADEVIARLTQAEDQGEPSPPQEENDTQT